MTLYDIFVNYNWVNTRWQWYSTLKYHNCLTSTRCCRYSCMFSWWLVKIQLETYRAVPDINKLGNVASCWICTGIYFRCTDPWTLSPVQLSIYLSVLSCGQPDDDDVLSKYMVVSWLDLRSMFESNFHFFLTDTSKSSNRHVFGD